MADSKVPIVLVHGLWNSPRIFKPLVSRLEQLELLVFAPHLPHRYGKTSLYNLADQLNEYIFNYFGENRPIDILGFSMGGIIARIWLQKMKGAYRTKRFISVGSPHQGTFLAQVVPESLFKGIAQMKINSQLLQEINRDLSSLKSVECISLFCPCDLMVVPAWKGTSPVGKNLSVHVCTHRSLITSSYSLEILVNLILMTRLPNRNAL